MIMYSKTCLNRSSLEQNFVFGTERCLVYTGWLNKDFLYWDLIFSSVYTGFRIIQHSVSTDFTENNEVKLNEMVYQRKHQLFFKLKDHFHSLLRFTPATVQLALQLHNKSSNSSFHPSTIACFVDITILLRSYSTGNILTRTITLVRQVWKSGKRKA